MISSGVVVQTPCDGVTETMSARNGGDAAHVTLVAVLGPLFVMVDVNVTARCTSTEPADVLIVTARSESSKTTTLIVSDDELFAEFGSGVVENTCAVLTIVVGVDGVRTTRRSRKSSAARQFAVCVDNDGYEVSLERNKIYVVLPDKDAEKDGDLRVVDERAARITCSPPIASSRSTFPQPSKLRS